MSKFRDYDNYEIYADGRIWSYKYKKFLKPETTKDGYQRVQLYDNAGKMKHYLLHRVIYESVTGEPIPIGMQCNHISEDKTDCSFSNLNLLSPKENINWGTRNKRSAESNTNNPKRSKQVCAYKNGELVFVFPSTREAQRQGFDSGHIAACCNGKVKTHKGYEWKYLNEKET